MEKERPPQQRDPEEGREVDYLICRTCNTPSYIFELESGRIHEAQCLICGNEEPADFDLGEGAGSDDP